MNNINLNAGGVIGAIVCGGIAGAFVFSRVEAGEGGSTKLVIAALIGGAFAGNSLWAFVFKKAEPQTPAPAPAPSPDRGR